MNDKSHVGMYNCPKCGEPIGILLDKHLRNSLERNNVIGPELCDKCVKELQDNNQLLMYEAEPNDKGMPKMTGRYVIIGDAIIKNEKNEHKKKFMQEKRFAFCDHEVYELIVKKGKENGGSD